MGAAFALRGLFLILVLPIGDPLDELFHFGYAEFVAATGRIPREREPSMPAEGTRVTALLPRSTSFGGPRLSWKEYISMSRSRQRERRIAALTTRPDERFRFVGSNYETQQPPAMYELAAIPLRALASAPVNMRLFAARALAVLAATIAVPFAYVFFRKLLPRNSAIAATLAFVAFPGLGTFTSRLTNDALALPIAAALLGILADVARGRLSRTKGVVLALLLAAGGWTKLYFLALLPAPLLAALLAPRERRPAVVRRAFAASLLALFLIAPWFARQRADTGDWLGLTESKTATRAGVGIIPRIAAVPRLFRPSIAKSFVATFLYPGTWAAMGAPGPAIGAAGLGLLIILILPRIRAGAASRGRRLAWAGSAAALAGFAVADLAHAATFAAISSPYGAGGDGWYLLILLPVVLAAGAAAGRAPRPRLYVAASLLFLVADWICTFGRLAAVYTGHIEGFDPRTPFSSYRELVFTPHAGLEVFSRVGLVDVPVTALAAIIAAWLLALLAAAGLALTRPGIYARVSRISPSPVSTSPRPAARSGAR